MRLHLVRHTVPDILPGICYGQTDVNVADTYTHDVEIVLEKLARIQPAVIYSSPLIRCSQLAEAIAAPKFCEVQHDSRLMELNFGDWELKAWDDIPRGLMDVWAEDLVRQAPPSGESFHALFMRVQGFLEEVTTNPSYIGKDVVALTHAGVIRAMLSHALNLPLADSFRFQIDYGSVTSISIEKAITQVLYVNR
ncbi:MAG TPA: alpha-ribazole phosphatase [Methylophilaceae bacterium]|nr:alpha-ribazole phosphatase [Methylophilaceae bacterium]